jgi:hypothetical protein
MERMSNDCTSWRERLTADAFGELRPDERLGVLAHREGCTSCDTLARELTSTVAALSLADPRAVDAIAPVPAELTERVLGVLKSNSHRVTSRRVAILTSIAAGAIAVVVAASVMIAGSDGTAHHSVNDALQTPAGVKATAILTSESWGTSLRFSESGQTGTSEYTVWMGTSDGTWWNAGTYHAVSGHRVVATMSCAVASSEITNIRVTTNAGVVVMKYGHGGNYRLGDTVTA